MAGYRSRYTSRSLKPWITAVITEETRSRRCVPRSVKIIEEIQGSFLGCHKYVTDGDVFIKTWFTEEAVREFIQALDGECSHNDWSKALVILKEFTVEFCPHEQFNCCTFCLKVTRFILWDLQQSFERKNNLTYCMEVPKIENKAKAKWLEWLDIRERQKNDKHLTETSTQEEMNCRLTQLLELAEDSQIQAIEIEDVEGTEDEGQKLRPRNSDVAVVSEQREPAAGRSRRQADQEHIGEATPPRPDGQEHKQKRNVQNNLLTKPFSVEDFYIQKKERLTLDKLPGWSADCPLVCEGEVEGPGHSTLAEVDQFQPQTGVAYGGITTTGSSTKSGADNESDRKRTGSSQATCAQRNRRQHEQSYSESSQWQKDVDSVVFSCSDDSLDFGSPSRYTQITRYCRKQRRTRSSRRDLTNDFIASKKSPSQIVISSESVNQDTETGLCQGECSQAGVASQVILLDSTSTPSPRSPGAKVRQCQSESTDESFSVLCPHLEHNNKSDRKELQSQNQQETTQKADKEANHASISEKARVLEKITDKISHLAQTMLSKRRVSGEDLATVSCKNDDDQTVLDTLSSDQVQNSGHRNSFDGAVDVNSGNEHRKLDIQSKNSQPDKENSDDNLAQHPGYDLSNSSRRQLPDQISGKSNGNINLTDSGPQTAISSQVSNSNSLPESQLQLKLSSSSNDSGLISPSPEAEKSVCSQMLGKKFTVTACVIDGSVLAKMFHVRSPETTSVASPVAVTTMTSQRARVTSSVASPVSITTMTSQKPQPSSTPVTTSYSLVSSTSDKSDETVSTKSLKSIERCQPVLQSNCRKSTRIQTKTSIKADSAQKLNPSSNNTKFPVRSSNKSVTSVQPMSKKWLQTGKATREGSSGNIQKDKSRCDNIGTLEPSAENRQNVSNKTETNVTDAPVSEMKCTDNDSRVVSQKQKSGSSVSGATGNPSETDDFIESVLNCHGNSWLSPDRDHLQKNIQMQICSSPNSEISYPETQEFHPVLPRHDNSSDDCPSDGSLGFDYQQCSSQKRGTTNNLMQEKFVANDRTADVKLWHSKAAGKKRELEEEEKRLRNLKKTGKVSSAHTSKSAGPGRQTESENKMASFPGESVQERNETIPYVSCAWKYCKTFENEDTHRGKTKKHEQPVCPTSSHVENTEGQNITADLKFSRNCFFPSVRVKGIKRCSKGASVINKRRKFSHESIGLDLSIDRKKNTKRYCPVKPVVDGYCVNSHNQWDNVLKTPYLSNGSNSESLRKQSSVSGTFHKAQNSGLHKSFSSNLEMINSDKSEHSKTIHSDCDESMGSQGLIIITDADGHSRFVRKAKDMKEDNLSSSQSTTNSLKESTNRQRRKMEILKSEQKKCEAISPRKHSVARNSKHCTSQRTSASQRQSPVHRRRHVKNKKDKTVPSSRRSYTESWVTKHCWHVQTSSSEEEMVTSDSEKKQQCRMESTIK